MNETILKRVEPLPFFSKAALATIEDIQPKALYQNLQRWVKSGLIIRLKNGLYVTRTHADRSLHDPSYLELVANKLAMPSYLSLEYVLQKNGLLTEATFPITSVTLKTTRRYKNSLGAFHFHHLKKRLYFGFEQRRYGGNLIYEATPAKALFDFLYLRLAGLDPKDISTLEEMRINWSELDRTSIKELRETILKSGVRKMVTMIPLMEKIYHYYGNSRQRS